MYLINALGKNKKKVPSHSLSDLYFFPFVGNWPIGHLQSSWVARCISLDPWYLTADCLLLSGSVNFLLTLQATRYSTELHLIIPD